MIYKGVLLGEQRASKTRREGSNPSVLADCPVMELVRRPGCPPVKTGSIPVQGAFPAVAERRGSCFIRSVKQVRLLPAGLNDLVEQLVSSRA